MRNDTKQLWLEALRSGNYSQGTQVLHNVDSNAYCCLGVLCDLVVPESERIVRDCYLGLSNGGITPIKVTAYINDVDYTVLPAVVMNAAGLDSQTGMLHYELEQPDGFEYSLYLSTLNDSGFTFNQIADMIDYFIPGE